ncbi:MAG: DNA-protecting protein DprA [Eubacteriaceae bacterium]|nr:DNA-protecting protein DprA [Eubacteriaceae bacterium]
MNHDVYWLWLKGIEKLSPLKINKLLTKFNDAYEIYNASYNELLDGELIDKTIADNIYNNKDLDKAEKELELLHKNNVSIVTPQSVSYTSNLKNIYNSPIIMYKRGQYELTDDDVYVAIIGSRKATQYGIRTAWKLSYELAKKGIVIVSGLAYGIDAAAHKGALDAGGKTVAVLGCGIDVIYPKSNEALYKEILKSGCTLSEYGLGMEAAPYMFPTRNRIISGLSSGCVIVEAAEKSGALITAKLALEQNREVFAVPGNITSPESYGANELIKRSAAKLVTSYEDILIEIVPSYNKKENIVKEEKTDMPEMNEEENKLYRIILKGTNTIDEIAVSADMSTSSVSSILTMMEINGIVYKDKGKFCIL